MRVEEATAGDGYPVREGTLVTDDTMGYYGTVVSLDQIGEGVMAAVACDDERLRSFSVHDLSVITQQGG